MSIIWILYCSILTLLNKKFFQKNDYKKDCKKLVYFFVVILSIHLSLKEIDDTCLEQSLATNICKCLFQKKDEGKNWFGFLKTDDEDFVGYKWRAAEALRDKIPLLDDEVL